MGLKCAVYEHADAAAAFHPPSQALKLPGVIAVYTGEDLARWTKPIHTEIYFPGYLAADREALARTKVRFVGEQVAVVVAEDRYIVEDAVELVQVEYEVLPSVVDVEEAKQPGAPQVHDHIPNNIIFKGEFATPNFDREHTAGKHTLSERFRTATPFHQRSSIEQEGLSLRSVFDVGRPLSSASVNARRIPVARIRRRAR